MIDPKLIHAYNNRGAAYFKLKDYQKAIADYDKAIEIDPKDADTLFNRACAYAIMKNKEQSLKDLSEAIKLDNKYREDVKKDEDFKALWDDEDFKKLTS